MSNSKAFMALHTINRQLRKSVKKEVAENYDKLINRIDQLNEENRKLKKCVEYYANKKNWQFRGANFIPWDGFETKDNRNGKTARECLEFINEKEKES